jgi:hypothetical protein
MHIVHHPRCKDAIQDESRAKLPVLRRTDAHGQWIVSFWKPSAEELESLIAGGGVELHMKAPSAHQHPVVSMATWPAIGPEFIDGDTFMQRTTGYRCFECCANESQPHAEHCLSLLSAIQFARSMLPQGSDPCGPTESPPLSPPPTVATVLQKAIAFTDLRTDSMVEIFRAAGHKIPAHCAAEDAFILDRMMRAVLNHGDKWARVFTAQLRIAQDVAIEKHEAATLQGSA